MTYVPPDGPVPCIYAIVGEAPGSEEVRLGRGFVGPSGKILWPVLRRLAGLERGDCYVTNLCKHQLDDEADVKLEPEEFEECSRVLCDELAQVRPVHILAVGALAAKALLRTNYSKMEVCNGVTYQIVNRGQLWDVTPCWHPAAALHDNGGKDPLAWMGDAMAHFTTGQRYVKRLTPPPWEYKHMVTAPMIALDTEGTVDDPQCVTWSDGVGRYMVPTGGLQTFWKFVRLYVKKICYHNAPWDWAVLEAMGVCEPWRVPFVDTMELAYLKQTEPQGLKDLGRRWLGLEMKTWEEVVMPHYEEIVVNMAAGKVDAGTTITTHSPKTGKVYKVPKVQRSDEAKMLARLSDPTKIAERLGFEAPSLRFVPFEVMAEYATLDPWVCMKVYDALR